MASTELRTAAAKVDDAFQAYANEHGDGFADRDYRGAYDYREEGYRLGEEAHDLPAEDRDDFIDAQSYAFPEGAQYLVAVAADYRLAELVKAEAPADVRVAA